MASSVDGQTRIKRIASSIRVIPNFPKSGVMFQDITTLLLDPKAFRDTVELFVERYRDMQISVVAGFPWITLLLFIVLNWRTVEFSLDDAFLQLVHQLKLLTPMLELEEQATLQNLLITEPSKQV